MTDDLAVPSDLAEPVDAPEAAAEPPPAETELKFEFGPTDLRKLIKHPALSGAGETLRMTSVYYDTPDFALRKAGIHVRVRQIGELCVQTVKRNRASGVFARDEWETSVAGLEFERAALPGPAAKALKKIEGDLVPVFKAVTDRTIRNWSRDGATVEVAVDRGELRAGKARQRLSELELELTEGAPEAVHALARELFAIAPIRLSLTSKGERGYRLVSDAPAGRAATPGLAPDMTIAEAFCAIGVSCLVQIIDAADSFRREPAPEAIHQTRIGLRRLRTALKIFKQAVDDDRYGFIDGEVRWLADELGGARNLDVFFEETFLPAAPELLDPKVAARYQEQLEKARKTAYRRAEVALASPRFAALSLELALWLEAGVWRQATDRARLDSLIGPFATDALDRLRKGVKEGGEDFMALNIDSRHKLRIRAKRLRYATDFFAKAFAADGAKKRREFEKALKALQTSLGELNDIAQANRSAIEALDGSSSTALTFAAGELVGSLKTRAPKSLARAEAAFSDFADAKRFWPKSAVKKVKPAKKVKAVKPDAAPEAEPGSEG